MKKFFIILALLFPLVAICQNWQWAKMYGGTGDDWAGAWFVDNGNNIYLTGNFSSKLYMSTDTFISNGANDILFIKCDQNGNEIWAKHFGGNNPSGSYENISWCAPDINGNYIFISGTFYTSLTIDSLHVNYSHGMDMFLAKFDLNGNCVWLKNAGGLGQNKSGAFQVDANNNLILTGTNSDSASFGNFKVPAGSFLVKYDSDGNCLWAKQKFSGILFCSMKFLGDDLVATGTAINDTVVIDTITFPNPYHKAVIARFDTAGNVKWAKSEGLFGISVNVDNQYNIYYSGLFEYTATFDGIPLNATNKDFFFIKYDQFGSLKWVKQSNASNTASIGIGNTDVNGNTYLAGSFTGNALFGNYPVSSSLQGDFFVARYDTSGNCIGINHFGNRGYEGGGVITDNNGYVIVSGQFINTITIGTNVLTSINSSTPDFFVAKCDAITGVSEINKFVNNQLLIYANPTTGKCNITIPDDFLNEKNLTLTIFDNNGKLIQQQKLEMSEGKIKLNLEQEAKGVYNIILSNGKKNYTGKIVFE